MYVFQIRMSLESYLATQAKCNIQYTGLILLLVLTHHTIYILHISLNVGFAVLQVDGSVESAVGEVSISTVLHSLSERIEQFINDRRKRQ